MKTLAASIVISLILLSPAFANDAPAVRFDAPDVIARSAGLVPDMASLLVDGVKNITRAVTSVGADVPRHASHTPQLAVNAGGRSVTKAKVTASEGMMGFSSLSSYCVRIVSSSFWALVSGILRF